jgi:hypothetical protein
LMLLLITARRGLHRFVDLQTGSVYDTDWYQISDDFIEPMEIGRWSPDSRQFAFAVLYSAPTLNTGTVPQLGIYSVEVATQTLRLIAPHVTVADAEGGGVKIATEFTWSADSAHFLLVEITCHDGINCGYPPPVLKLVRLDDLAVLAERVISDPGSACLLTPSPTLTYVIFQSYCPSLISGDLGGAEYFKELFVWEVRRGSIIQLTSYTNTQQQIIFRAEGIGLTSYITQYAVLWETDSQVLLSVSRVQIRYGEGVVAGTLITELVSYAFPSYTRTVYDLRRYQEMRKNPVTGAIAYRIARQQIVNVPLQDGQFTTAVQDVGEAQVGIEIFTERPSYFPAGCNLRWSPDGSMLGYAQPVKDNLDPFGERCRPRLFTFVETESPRAWDYAPNNPTSIIRTLGWIAVPVGTVIAARFPNGTPTPVVTPTSAPAG